MKLLIGKKCDKSFYNVIFLKSLPKSPLKTPQFSLISFPSSKNKTLSK